MEVIYITHLKWKVWINELSNGDFEAEIALNDSIVGKIYELHENEIMDLKRKLEFD